MNFLKSCFHWKELFFIPLLTLLLQLTFVKAFYDLQYMNTFWWPWRPNHAIFNIKHVKKMSFADGLFRDLIYVSQQVVQTKVCIRSLFCD
jgi:hypothetical protein